MEPFQFTQPSGHVLLPMYSMPDKRSRGTINYKDLSLIFIVFISWSKSSSVEVPPERFLSHTTIRETIRASGPKVTHLSDQSDLFFCHFCTEVAVYLESTQCSHPDGPSTHTDSWHQTTCWGITLDTPITIKAMPSMRLKAVLINIHDSLI